MKIPDHTLKAAENLSLRDLLELEEGLLNAYLLRALAHGQSTYRRRHHKPGEQPSAAWLQLSQFLFVAGHATVDEAFKATKGPSQPAAKAPANSKPSSPPQQQSATVIERLRLSQMRAAECLQEWFKEEAGMQIFTRRAAKDWLNQRPWLNGDEIDTHLDNGFKLLIADGSIARIRTGQYLVVNTIPVPNKVHK